MRVSAIWLCVFFWGALVPGAATAQGVGPVGLEAMRTEARTALVIGNADYRSSPLANPANDARLVATTLRKLGFEVVEGHNLDQRGMKRKVSDFGRSLQKRGGVGVFYFAGHGMRIKGQNFLVPIGAQIEGEADVEIESVALNAILRRMGKADNRLNLVILDACRDNPYAAQTRAIGGLASIEAPDRTLVAYATAPESVAADGKGSNGVYTEALVAEMNSAYEVGKMFRMVRTRVKVATADAQVPWESTSLEGDFYFVLPKKLVTPTVVCPAGTRRKGSRCIPTIDKSCPKGTRMVRGKGCVGKGPVEKVPQLRKKAEQLDQKRQGQKALELWMRWLKQNCAHPLAPKIRRRIVINNRVPGC